MCQITSAYKSLYQPVVHELFGVLVLVKLLSTFSNIDKDLRESTAFIVVMYKNDFKSKLTVTLSKLGEGGIQDNVLCKHFK